MAKKVLKNSRLFGRLKEFKSIFNELNVSVFLIDRDFRIFEYNEKTRDYLGIPKKKTIQNQKCHEVFFHLPEPCEHCILKTEKGSIEEIYHKKKIITQIIDIEKPGKLIPETQYFEKRQYAIKTLGKEYLIVSALDNVTWLKKKENDQKQNEKLISLGTVVHTVAHDMQNPLLGLRLTLQTMSDKNLSMFSELEYKDKIQLLENDVNQLSRIVDEIKNVTGRKKFRMTPIELKPVIEASLERIIRLTETKINADWAWQVPEDIMLMGNATNLESIFINLFKNSIEAFQETGRQLFLNIWIEAKPKNLSSEEKSKYYKQNVIELSITDNAGGIPAGIIHRVFDPFFSTKRARSGTGIGLFHIHKIIDEHGGSIEVDSKGDYTKFSMNLPVIENIK